MSESLQTSNLSVPLYCKFGIQSRSSHAKRLESLVLNTKDIDSLAKNEAVVLSLIVSAAPIL